MRFRGSHNAMAPGCKAVHTFVDFVRSFGESERIIVGMKRWRALETRKACQRNSIERRRVRWIGSGFDIKATMVINQRKHESEAEVRLLKAPQ
jgi:hypothetical protein